MRRDPRQTRVQLSALEYFTNRENAIEAFKRYLNAPEGEPMQVLNFYGVGGIGKSTLLRKLWDIAEREYPKLPRALFNLDSLRDHFHPYREVLLSWRLDIERQHGVKFPRFDLCLAVMLAREGDTPPDLIQKNPCSAMPSNLRSNCFKCPTRGWVG